jgi:hypothetical protein
MKKGLLLLLLMMMSACVGNNIIVKKYEPALVIHYSDLQKLENVSDLKKYAGYIDKGETLPLELKIENDMVGIKQKIIDIEIKRRIYFMMKLPENPTKEELEKLAKLDFASMSEAEMKNFFKRYMLYLSIDAEHWAPLYDGRALKHVLGIKKGTFSLGIGADKDKGIKSIFTLKTEK